VRIVFLCFVVIDGISGAECFSPWPTDRGGIGERKVTIIETFTTSAQQNLSTVENLFFIFRS
jgi:hypothetical protein